MVLLFIWALLSCAVLSCVVLCCTVLCYPVLSCPSAYALSPTRGAGLMQAVPDTISLDALKHRDDHFTTLYDFFVRYALPCVFGRRGGL